MKKYIFIVTLFIFCIGLAYYTGKYPDNDLWARLIAGKYIVEHLTVLKYDFLSYTPTHPWYDHEWGASVVFYIMFKYFGASGLVFLKGILSALTVFFCYKTVGIRSEDKKNALNVLCLYVMDCSLRLRGYSKMFTVYLFILCHIFIYIGKIQKKRRKMFNMAACYNVILV